MVADNATAGRLHLAVELQQAIDGHQYDWRTFQELTQVLDHEYLRIVLVQGSQPNEVLQQRALTRSWTEEVVMQLSSCLIRSIGAGSHLERELQCRGLLSALALLRAQESEALHTDYYEELHRRIQGRFRDLRWQESSPDRITPETFRKAQCAYLIYAGAEYAKHFRRAQPVLVTGLYRAMDFMFFATQASTMVCLPDIACHKMLTYVHRPVADPATYSQCYKILTEH